MPNARSRALVGHMTDPIARWLVRRGVSPDTVTLVGTAGAVAAPVWFIPRDELITGVLITTALILFDVLDGTMARLRGGGTAFGGVLDSVCDRLADGAVFGSIGWWCFMVSGQPALGMAALICLVVGPVVPYVKARAEAAGLSAGGGVAGRVERLVVAGVGMLLEGLGVPYALAVTLWLVVAASVLTVAQRLVAAYRSALTKGVAG